MTIRISAHLLDAAAEALMMAAMSARDPQGFKIVADLPRPQPRDMPDDKSPEALREMMRRSAPDLPRIRAITLGALTAMLNGPCMPDDEVPVTFADLARAAGRF